MPETPEALRHIAAELAENRKSNFENCRIRFDELTDLCMIDVIIEEARHEGDIDQLIDLGAEMRDLEDSLGF